MNFKSKLPADPTSMILGIVSLVIVIIGCCCGLLSIVALALSIVGLVMANKSLKEYDVDPSIYEHKSRQNVYIGKILCIIGVIVSTLFVIVWTIYFIFVGETLGDQFMEKFNQRKELGYEMEADSVYTDYEMEIESDSIDMDTIRIDTIKQN